MFVQGDRLTVKQTGQTDST